MTSDADPPESDDPPAPKSTAERSRKAREKRRGQGQVQVLAWVPAGRAEYARRLLAHVLAGSNTLPPDPEQAETVAALQARAGTLDAALTIARGDLDAARSRADADAQVLAEAQASIDRATTDLAAERATIRRYHRTGWRGRLIDLLARD